MSERLVTMTGEQAQILEDIGVELMRESDQRAMKVLSLSLAWKFATPLEPEVPSNVYPIVRHAGDSWSRRVGPAS